MFGWLRHGRRPEDANTQRRKIVNGMFYWLLFGILISLGGLVVVAGMFMGILLPSGAVDPSPSTGTGTTTTTPDQFIQGVVLTSITGTIAGLLTYMGMIVKGFVDNLTLVNEGNDKKRAEEGGEEA